MAYVVAAAFDHFVLRLDAEARGLRDTMLSSNYRHAWRRIILITANNIGSDPWVVQVANAEQTESAPYCWRSKYCKSQRRGGTLTNAKIAAAGRRPLDNHTKHYYNVWVFPLPTYSQHRAWSTGGISFGKEKRMKVHTSHKTNVSRYNKIIGCQLIRMISMTNTY